jgi:hypothetical protein
MAARAQERIGFPDFPDEFAPHYGKKLCWTSGLIPKME